MQTIRHRCVAVSETAGLSLRSDRTNGQLEGRKPAGLYASLGIMERPALQVSGQRHLTSKVGRTQCMLTDRDLVRPTLIFVVRIAQRNGAGFRDGLKAEGPSPSVSQPALWISIVIVRGGAGSLTFIASPIVHEIDPHAR